MYKAFSHLPLTLLSRTAPLPYTMLVSMAMLELFLFSLTMEQRFFKITYDQILCFSFASLLQCGHSPLHHGCMKGITEIVSLLLDKQVQVDEVDSIVSQSCCSQTHVLRI